MHTERHTTLPESTSGGRRTVVTILALGYCGSHYLSLLLGSHSRTLHLGELNFAAKRPDKQKLVCSLCKDNTTCPVFHDIGPKNIHNAYETIFSRFPSKTTLIDASKGIWWAKLFMHNPAFQKKYIHLIRDPMALIRRWRHTYTTPKQRIVTRLKVIRDYPWRTVPLLFDPLDMIYMRNWVMRNRWITEFIRRNRLDARIVSYRDLARNTAAELAPLMQWMGLEYEPSQLEYWNVVHHGSQKAQYEWVKQEKTQHIDLRWQTELSPELIARVREDAEINDYLREIGYTFTDDGITRTAVAPATR